MSSFQSIDSKLERFALKRQVIFLKEHDRLSIDWGATSRYDTKVCFNFLWSKNNFLFFCLSSYYSNHHIDQPNETTTMFPFHFELWHRVSFFVCYLVLVCILLRLFFIRRFRVCFRFRVRTYKSTVDKLIQNSNFLGGWTFSLIFALSTSTSLLFQLGQAIIGTHECLQSARW